VVLLVDSKVGATPLDVQALDYLVSLDVPCVVVATKVDRLKQNKRRSSLAEIRQTLGLSEDHRLIPVSARSGEGTKELWKTVDAHIGAAAGSK
jgi:GTP-binding protein